MSLAQPIHAYVAFQTLEAAVKYNLEIEDLTDFSDIANKIDREAEADSWGLGEIVNWEKHVTEGGAKAEDEYPLFVTWNKHDRPITASNPTKHEEANLRGCIGTFWKLPVEEGLRGYALQSGLRDSRFRPISARELPRLQCGISFLTPFETARDPLDWTLGTHGIQITINLPSNPTRRYSATYLPEVAPSQGWDKVETILNLIRKSGYRSTTVKPGDEVWNRIELKRYRSDKVLVEWWQYVEWKKKCWETSH